jgi:methionyl-tRNA formyltransferase
LKLFVASSSFVAKPTILSLLADKNYDLIGLITNPDKATGRGKQIEANELANWANLANINTFKPGSVDDLRSLVLENKPDIVLTIAYGRLIPQEILEIPKYGWINVHFSILPKWRGAAPVQWAILSGDTKTGISIFKLDKGMDTGPIYLQQETKIDVDEKSEQLLERLSLIGSDLSIKALKLIKNGVLPTPQDSTGVSFAPKFNKNDGQIKWTMRSDDIYKHYRALSANPGVWTSIGEMRIKIDSLRISHGQEQLKPGVVVIDKENLLIGTGNGVIQIEKLTPAGRNQMSAAEFIRGLTNRNGLKVG